jgi:hypothetical protein
MERGSMKSREFKGPAVILGLVLVLFFFASCASKPDIIGKWREVGKKATLEFLTNGTFKAIDNQGMAVSGKYTLSKDGNLRCEIQKEESTEEVINLTTSIKGDELTLTSSDSSEVESYRREK